MRRRQRSAVKGREAARAVILRSSSVTTEKVPQTICPIRYAHGVLRFD